MLFKRKEKMAKEPPKGKQRVLRCPQCGSSDLYYENALVTGYKYHCKKCDYIGALVLEEEYDVDEVLEDKEED